RLEVLNAHPGSLGDLRTALPVAQCAAKIVLADTEPLRGGFLYTVMAASAVARLLVAGGSVGRRRGPAARTARGRRRRRWFTRLRERDRSGRLQYAGYQCEGRHAGEYPVLRLGHTRCFRFMRGCFARIPSSIAVVVLGPPLLL